MHPAAERVQRAAHALGLAVEIREYPDSTRTAEEAARAIGCGVGQIVKSLIFLSEGHPILALVSRANRLDVRKLARAVGSPRVERADAQAARAATGYVIGGMPPFGHLQPLPVYIDEDLLQHEVVWAAAGTPHAVFAIAARELVRTPGGRGVDLREDRSSPTLGASEKGGQPHG